MRTNDPLRTIRKAQRSLFPVSLFLLLGLAAAPAGAQWAVAGKAGTLGVGVEVAHGLLPHLEGRLGVNGFNYSDRRSASQIDYDATAKLRNATAFLDLHPGGGGFRLTGGLVWNGNKVDAKSRPSPTGTYDIGGVLIPVSIVERLDGRADFNTLAPYAGIGWGHPATSAGHSGFLLDLGVMFQGKPKIHLTPVIPQGSPILTTPGAREALNILVRREEQDIEDDASKYDTYPVVSLGFWVKF
jgi:hypothetical protein